MTTSPRGRASNLGLVLLLICDATAHAAPSHDRQFWRDIANHHYEVPNGAPVPVLARELSALFASPDPELRDDLSYSILAHWIAEGRLSNSALSSLSDEWRTNLKSGIGETGTNSVLKRSYSALCLAELAARDLTEKFLGPDRYRGLLTDALTYLNQETDLRGYDLKLGWIHATAHTADLLRVLAMNPLFTKTDQRNVWGAISDRFFSAHDIYTHGEQGRLALTVAAIIQRADYDEDIFNSWLTPMRDADRATWTHTPISLEQMARYHRLPKARLCRQQSFARNTRFSPF